MSDKRLEENAAAGVGEGRRVLASEVRRGATGKEMPGRKIDAP